ncbi:MAG: cell division protein FtsX [Sphingomonadaceae bacterium]
MARFFSASPADQRLLPEGRLSGPMPWVIAIMMFLTVLAAAAGIALSAAASDMGQALAGRVTVQIPEPQPALREAQSERIVSELRQLAVVDQIRPVPETEIVALLEPWLGKDGLEADLPLPAMIDVTLERSGPRDLDLIRRAVTAIAPSARVDSNAQWLGPLSSLITSLQWLAAALVLLMAIAMSAAVVLSARAALNTHRPTIDIMHLLGATDVQLARLFQRRIALDALFGGTIGLLAALVVLALIGARISAIGSDLLAGAHIGLIGWLVIGALPLLGAALSTLAARFTVLRALRRAL